MKIFFTAFFLVALGFVSNGQTDKKPESSFVLIIGGESFSNSSPIDTQHLKLLDSLQLKNLKTQRLYPAHSYKWIVAHQGQVIRGSYPASGQEENRKKPSLTQLAQTLAKDDVVFLQNITVNGGKTTLPGQWALKVE